MDDGEVEISDHTSLSVDSFLDELLRTSQTCTHTHTCNPSGPDEAHTHTCYHTHTQVIPPEKTDDDLPNDTKTSPSKPHKRNSGNREAVRKYREKKKAQSTYLEEEVKKLRFVNQQLMKKVQKQAILESEILRLRGILFDLRSKIDGELGTFPFEKKCNSDGITTSSLREGNCGGGGGVGFSGGGAMKIRCDDLSCFHPNTN